MHLYKTIADCASSTTTTDYFHFPVQGRLKSADVVMGANAAGGSVSSAVVIAENKSSATVATIALSSAATSAGTIYNSCTLNSSSSNGNTYFNPNSASSYATGVKITVAAGLIGTSGTDLTVHFDYDEFGRKHL